MFEVRTLTDGGQAGQAVEGGIARIRRERSARSTWRTTTCTSTRDAPRIRGAIRAANARGVAVRFIYDVGHRNPIPVPPPPEPDAQLIATLGVRARAIAGVPDLMHHKYVVRDGETVWTGSMNWTNDSFSRQENWWRSSSQPPLAAGSRRTSSELWTTGSVEQSGRVPRTLDRRPGGARLVHAGLRRGALDPHRAGDRESTAARPDRLAGDHDRSRAGVLAQVSSEEMIDLAGCVDQTQLAASSTNGAGTAISSGSFRCSSAR